LFLKLLDFNSEEARGLRAEVDIAIGNVHVGTVTAQHALHFGVTYREIVQIRGQFRKE
jgi:hypothetical protein